MGNMKIKNVRTYYIRVHGVRVTSYTMRVKVLMMKLGRIVVVGFREWGLKDRSVGNIPMKYVIFHSDNQNTAIKQTI